MTHLDEKALEAAREQPGTNHEATIRAYIDAIMPMKVSGLVERLRQYEGRSWETTHCYNGTRDEAAISIENLSAGLATVWRNKLEAEDALASERAAHAETKRMWEQSCAMGAMQKDRLAEALKALEPFADIADLIDCETGGMSETDELALHFHDYLMASWPVSMFRAARRVREGGKVE